MWEEHARAQRRAVRDAIEQARSTLMDTVRVRGAPAPRAAQMFIRLETADQLFNALIALSDLLEQHRAEDRRCADRLLRRLRPIALVLGRAIQTDSVKPNRQVERSIAAIEHDIAALPADSQLRGIGTVIAERLRVALTLNVPANYSPGAGGGRAESLGARLLGPLRSNLSWNSVAFRHAARTAIVVAPAIALTVIWYQPYEHWFTITLVMTLQPYFALTITRALERIGGTILGGLLAALIALVSTSPVSIAVAMFPLAMAALAVRQVSFGLFTAAITPIVVLLSELGSPGTSEWTIAGMRALLTVSGGLLALLAAFLLWPSWEPVRLPAELRAAIAAHAAYARATFASLGVPNSLANWEPVAAETVLHETRRVAGIASNNLEASLSRVLQEPRHMPSDQIEAVMVIDAALRRFAGRLSVMELDPALAGAPRETLCAWEAWLCGSLERLSAPALPVLDPRPAEPAGTLGDSFSRAARQVELMAGAIARVPARF